jgi:hypothetical protein
MCFGRHHVILLVQQTILRRHPHARLVKFLIPTGHVVTSDDPKQTHIENEQLEPLMKICGDDTGLKLHNNSRSPAKPRAARAVGRSAEGSCASVERVKTKGRLSQPNGEEAGIRALFSRVGALRTEEARRFVRIHMRCLS